MALRVGERVWAEEVVERTVRLLGDTAEVWVLRAVVQAHRGRADTARGLLAPVTTGAVPAVVPATLLEAWLWEARLADRVHDHVRAHKALVAALALAAEHGLLRPFAAAGHEVQDLLAREAGRFGHHEGLAARIRTAHPLPNPVGTASLTTRELELLLELTSHHTAGEIAASMSVSLNTNKTHVRGIYRKLDVNSRREAIVVARRRGLI
jgi:LuxR family maltose regulon positive regulatory protein